MKKPLIKGFVVVCGAMALSSIGLFAADSVRDIDRSLVGLTGMSGGGGCESGSVHVSVGQQTLCVDLYEASASEECPNQAPQSTLDTERNLKTGGCAAVSKKGVVPWRYVSLPQAQRLCAEVGKRLPTPDEWYRIALGTEEESCVTQSSGAAQTGSSNCVSAAGVYDMVGNVWEWVDVTVTGRTYSGRELPEEGYVHSVDNSGVAITTSDQNDVLYGDDYFWSGDDGVYGMIRGGFYGSNSDAGLYALNASVATSFASQGVGFRCVQNAAS